MASRAVGLSNLVCGEKVGLLGENSGNRMRSRRGEGGAKRRSERETEYRAVFAMEPGLDVCWPGAQVRIYVRDLGGLDPFRDALQLYKAQYVSCEHSAEIDAIAAHPPGSRLGTGIFHVPEVVFMRPSTAQGAVERRGRHRYVLLGANSETCPLRALKLQLQPVGRPRVAGLSWAAARRGKAVAPLALRDFGQVTPRAS